MVSDISIISHLTYNNYQKGICVLLIITYSPAEIKTFLGFITSKSKPYIVQKYNGQDYVPLADFNSFSEALYYARENLKDY